MLVYVVSVWVSSKYADSYWIVGSVFGAAVVSWDSNNFKNLVALKHLSFLVVSTLIYALVYHISRQNWAEGDVAQMLIGPLPVAVAVGSVLLPLAQKFLFAETAKQPIPITLSLLVSFYVVSLISFFNDRLSFAPHVNFLLISIAVWQGLYLYLFYKGKQ